MESANEDTTDDISLRTLVGSTGSYRNTSSLPATPTQASFQNLPRRRFITFAADTFYSTGTLSPSFAQAMAAPLSSDLNGRQPTASRSSSAVTLQVAQAMRLVSTDGGSPDRGAPIPLVAPRRLHQAGPCIRGMECPVETLIPAVCLSSLAAGALGLIFWRSIDPKAGQS